VLKVGITLSLLLIVMGTLDCLTTVIGVLYFGASEINPVMAGIVSTNLGAFLVIKLSATMIAASSFLFANKILMQVKNKNTKTFTYSSNLIKIATASLLVFIIIVVTNNMLVLLA
jgi:hypothetical protein